jgi:ubiquinol-cytochrome c reductase cytochrome b subunit
MFARVFGWINDRWPLSALLRLGREEEIIGGASFSYTLGSAALTIFLLQLVTGIWQLFYYVPTVDYAYDSLNHLRTQVPFGWLIHGLHYWGASAMILIVALHLARVFIWGAYKGPRELTWLSGVALLLLTMSLSFSGAPLPWDERGYWAIEVGTSIAGTVPIVGDLIKRLMRGGEMVGQLTLSRFFILHAAILPGIVMALIGVHVVAFRRFGSVGPWGEAKRALKGPFWPDQVFKDAVVGTFILLLLISLSVFAPPPISGPADPVDTSFVPKPEWNFLFLYQALKFFPSRLELLGTVGIPTLAILLLVLLPFVDRRPERHPARRPIALAGGLIAAAGVVTLTMAGLTSRPEGIQAATAPRTGSTTKISASARQGGRVFKSLGCNGCHRVNGVGGTMGPDLSHEALSRKTRLWLITQIRNPTAHNPRSIMPPFPSLSDQQLNELVDYLLSLAPSVTPTSPAPSGTRPAAAPRSPPPQAAISSPSTAMPVSPTLGPPGPAAEVIGSADHGGVLFTKYCASCHGSRGVGGILNPGSDSGKVPPLYPMARGLFNAEPRIFAENIDRFIQHGSAATGPSPQFHMPAFGDTNTLTQPEIADIEAYVLRLNGIERALLANPGLQPRRFFLLVVAMFGVGGIGLAGGWLWIHARLLSRRKGR